MSDAEPRRSVRSTKGQHKALDHHEAPTPAPDGTKDSVRDKDAAASSAAAAAAASNSKTKRGRKGSKKPESPQEDDSEEEIIRCVCGAREQDGDPGEPWIACDTCTAWQHNVCMGMSVYSEDLAKDYFCEQCKPENHKELLEGMARGEKPWEERRRQYEEEKANDKRRKGGRKAKPKRNSDAKEGSAKPSPTPEARRDHTTAKGGPSGTKRKTRADSEEDTKDGKPQRRKLSEEVLPVYSPPDDLPEHISDLVDARQTPAKGLTKAISEVLGGMQKRGEFTPKDGASVEATAERFGLQIERAVHDAHPTHKEYGTQIRTLRFNLKENHELVARLVHGSLIPPMLATMSSDELASRELQQKTAKMKAQAERQSIITEADDASAPRLRRTHKGEEVVGGDREGAAVSTTEDKPSSLRRQSARDNDVEMTDAGARRRGSEAGGRGAQGRGNLRVDTKSEGGNKKDFDLKRVFSSVRSPTSTTGHQRRPSQPQFASDGPGDDPDVDRLLQDDGDESPPYSPSEETDPDIVWRGQVNMNTVANFQATARHVGGVNLSATIGLPWTTLVPKKLTVAGRIDEQIATEYLCSLRYSAPTDISVASLSPATDAAKADFLAIIDYFTQRRRYGVVGEKGVGNVRDTYLVPIPSGTSSHPEFMLNLEDNFIPTSRTAPMLLLVVVYRNDPAAMEKLRGPNWAGQYIGNSGPTPGSVESTPSTATPQPPAAPGGPAGSRTASISAPAFSPMVPQTPSMPTQAQAQQAVPPTPTPPQPLAQPVPQRPQQQQALPPVQPPVQSQPPPPSQQQQQPLQPQPPVQHQPIATRPPVPPPAAVPSPASTPVHLQQPPVHHQPPQPPQQQQQQHHVSHPGPAAGHPPPPQHVQHQQQQQHPHPQHPQQQHQVHQPPHRPVGPPQAHPHPHPHPPPTAAQQAVAQQAAREQAQRDGEAIAREILGPLATCSAAGFLMTQAAKMQKNEWLLVRAVFEQQPQTQDDLQLLKHELERYNDRSHHGNTHHHHNNNSNRAATPTAAQQQQQQQQQAADAAAAKQHSQTPVPIPRVPHTSAAATVPASRPAPPAASPAPQPGNVQ